MRSVTQGAIVYLTQLKHSSYGRDSLGLLKRSVTLLFTNYNAVQQDDVIFFHTDMPADAQAEVLSLCTGSHAHFHEVPSHHFTSPAGTPPESTWRYRKKFSAGYRHMIRFFTSGLWHVMAEMGYAYVMRLDEDSFIWSPVKYNFFSYMAVRGFEYGYRLASLERDGQEGKYHSFVREYAVRRHVQPTWLLHSCRQRRLDSFTLRNCGPAYNVYNNWFVTKVSFWLRPDVQDYLNHINHTHVIYTERWGDLLWQSSALQLFMAFAKVFMFADFAYEHSTFSTVPFPANPSWNSKLLTGLNKTCMWAGGIALGSTSGAEMQPARERLLALANTPLCRIIEGKVVLRPCIVNEAQMNSTPRVTSFLLGSVSTVQGGCDRTPAPLYCNATAAAAFDLPAAGEKMSHVEYGYRRVQGSLHGLCCCHHNRASRFFWRASRMLGARLRGVSLAVHQTERHAARFGATKWPGLPPEDPPTTLSQPTACDRMAGAAINSSAMLKSGVSRAALQRFCAQWHRQGMYIGF